MTTPDLLTIPASCALCGAGPDCNHESESLELALRQAQDRWNRFTEIRTWVLHHARQEIARTFDMLKRERLDAHHTYLSKLPCYTVYQRYQGNPPISAAQLHQLRLDIAHAEAIFRKGINEDWQRSCMKYPVVLDYFFSMVQITFPDEVDPEMRDPRYGGQRRVKGRRES